MTKKLVVSASLLAKSQVASYTRSDGTVVQAHDNGRNAKAAKPAAGRVGARAKSSESASSKPSWGAAGWSHQSDAVNHLNKHGATLLQTRSDSVDFNHHGPKSLKMHWGDDGHRYVKTSELHAAVPPKAPKAASAGAPAEAAPKRQLKVKASAAAKTGSAAPAKMKNVGTDKWPLHAKSSDALGAKHQDGSTHHIGGFEPPAHGKGDHLIHHDGKTFSYSGKSGKNMKTGEASYEYRAGDSGEHRAWVTHSGHLMND